MANKTLSKYSDFNTKKFLVVDDFPEFRIAIKRMVEAFGATDIDTSSNGEDATSKLKAKKYDAVLCDYNLGDGKDGQQVMEEAKHSGYIAEWQIFILLTAENTAEMVMGALEYEPDTYLVKPFTKEMVHSRLMKVIEKKKDLEDVYKAIKEKDPNRAIAICDEKIAKNGKIVLPCLKVKGAQLMKMKKYNEVIKLYEPLLSARKLPWIIVVLGKAHFMLKDYKKALTYFEQIIEISDVNVEGLDWIARTQIELNDKVAAQRTLEKAVRLSSKAILRQQRLGDLAYENQDYEMAEKCFKAAVTLGKYSCYRRPQDFIIYAELLIKKASEPDSGRIGMKAGNDAVSSLENLSNIYRNDKKIQLQAYTLLSHAMLATSRKDKAKIMIKKALVYLEKDQIKVDDETMIKIGEALIEVDDKEKGENILKEYKKKND